ncbi:MAG: HAMP domain-containing protein, partial [Chloroflexi bacterium]
LTEEERVGPQGARAEERALNLLIAFRNRDIENINSYALLDINGNILFEYPRTENKGNESNRIYFTNVVETGTVYVSPVEFSPETGEPFFYFSALTVDSLGRQVGVLRARYDARVLQQLINRSSGLVGGESYAVLFDENYLHLAHGAAPETIFKLVDMPSSTEVTALQNTYRLPNLPLEQLSTDLPELQQSLIDTDTTPIFEATDVATGARINQAAAVLMEEQPWTVAFFQPQDVFLEPVDTLIRRTVFLTLITIFVVVGVAIALANIIARPILQLEKVANQVAEGDLTIQAPESFDSEVGALARAFNMMTAQIRDSVSNLERRVAERTRVIEISAQVSRNLTTILDPEQLVQEVVTQVRSAFDYYYAQIYLWDESQTQLVMAGGTGDAGAKMLARGHALAPGKGLVGRAAEMKLPVLIPDVEQEKGWLPNELLPFTKAETAVPILIGNEVIGVLDVQHSVENGLGQQDVELIQSVANQFAIAYQNAKNYVEQQKQAEYEALVNEIRQKIQSTTEVDSALKIAVRELGNALGAKRTTVKFNIQSEENGNGY